MSTRKRVLPLFVVLFAVPVWSKVFLRWTQPLLPPAERLGVHELAIPWNAVALPSFRGAQTGLSRLCRGGDRRGFFRGKNGDQVRVRRNYCEPRRFPAGPDRASSSE